MKDHDCDTTLMNAEGNAQSGSTIAVGLLHRGREYHIRPEDAPFVIGRDADSDLCIDSEYGSRKHCVIEYRESKFVLHDSSTNGTYVQLGRSDNVRIHNETMPLIGHGCFKPGENFRPGDPELIHFVIR